MYCIEDNFEIRNSVVSMLKHYELFSQDLVRFVTEFRRTLPSIGTYESRLHESFYYEEHLPFTTDGSIHTAFGPGPLRTVLRGYDIEEDCKNQVTMSRYVRCGTVVDVAERVRVSFVNAVRIPFHVAMGL